MCYNYTRYLTVCTIEFAPVTFVRFTIISPLELNSCNQPDTVDRVSELAVQCLIILVACSHVHCKGWHKK